MPAWSPDDINVTVVSIPAKGVWVKPQDFGCFTQFDVVSHD
jgi:hypothetical protein